MNASGPSMGVVIVDAGGANLASVRHAFERLGVAACVSADAATIESADRVVLPGVGAAGVAMRRLRERGLDRLIPALRQPVLGVCVGMQLLYERSEEGATECLGIFDGSVDALATRPGVRVPHMGWNRLIRRGDSPLTEGLADDAHGYFVHGYAARAAAGTVAACRHGDEFAAIETRANFTGVQFHPERSGAVGARVLRNWLASA